MNKICLTPALQRFSTVAILFTFLVLMSACSEVRYDNTTKRYSLGSDAGTTASYTIPAHSGKSYTVGADDNVTAHYTLKEGPGPDSMAQAQGRTTADRSSTTRYGDGPPATPDMAGKGPIIIEASDVLFDFDKWVIKKIYYPELDRWVAFFQDNPQINAEIYGHTDSTGPTDYNQKLSEKRAQAVIDYLVAKGVDPVRLSAMGFGENRPIAPNTTPEGRQKNRRVEVNF